MTVGFPAEAGHINNKAGSLSMAIRDTFRDIRDFNEFLITKDDADLGALGFSPEDITLLRNSFTDLAKLGQIAIGQDIQPDPSNFFFHAQHLVGVE